MLPLTGLLVYAMAVVRDWAPRIWLVNAVWAVVPGLLLPPAFRAHRPHRYPPPTAGGAVQWKSCCSLCVSHLPVTEPRCPCARAAPDGTMACMPSAWRHTQQEEGLAGEGRHGTCLSWELGQACSSCGHGLIPPKGAATSTLMTWCG